MRIEGTGRVPSGKDRNWTSVGLKTKESLTGWIAGPPIRTRVHQGQRSKLCPRVYLGPKAPCERCEEGRSLTDLVFVPFYPSDSELRYVLHCHDDAVPSIESLDLHDFFTAWRGIDPSTGVQITKSAKAIPFVPRIMSRIASADISEWLVRFLRATDWLTAEVLLGGGGGVPAGVPTVASGTSAADSVSPEEVNSVRKTVIGLADQFALSAGLSGDGTPYTERRPDGRVTVAPPHQNGRPKK